MKNFISLLSAMLLCMVVFSQTRQLSGRVVNDSTGEPLSGATIKLKGSKAAVTTDGSGNFKISVPVNVSAKIVISYTGYTDNEVDPGNSASVNIRLKPNDSRLDEVVVIGYGAVKKRDLTGAVASIKGDDIRKVPAGNFMESIQGKLAGVDVVRTSGSAGATPSVTIRGNRSFNASNNPLYIVDGIQYNSFQDINANDIQSMEVLKDAASTAIYGSRGANGVILITTKKGSTGKIKVSANAYYGVSDVAGYPKPMTGPQYADLKRQAYRTIGTWNSTADDPKVFTNATDLAAVQSGASTYWPGYNLVKGAQQDYGIGVSAGTEKTKVYFSFDYFNEKGLLRKDFSDRFSLRLNIDQYISKNFRVGLESQLAYYNQNIRADGILTVANKVIPYFSPFNADGTVAKFPGNGNQFNPLLQEVDGAYSNKTNTTRILSTAYAEWKPLRGLTIRSNLGIVNGSSRNLFFNDANTIDRALSSGSLSRVANTTGTNITWENIITWQKEIKDHSISITGVTSYLSNKADSSYAQGTGQLLGSQGAYALQNNPANLAIYSNYIGSNLMSGAFRINYAFRGKYLLTVTGRADGASVLSEGNKWSYFPSVAVAWRIKDEKFMLNQNLFSDLKLRASYGVAGNAAVAPYQTSSGIVLIPYSWNDVTDLAYGLNPQIGNPDLGWELTNTLNIGLDFGILKNRISGSFDYYDSQTHDLLMLRKLPPTTGGSSILQNIGKTRNSGFEIAINTVNIQGRDFKWTSNITYTRNKERIVELPNNTDDIANSWFVGYPVKTFYDYEKVGIWQTADSTAAKAYGYKPGDIRVSDLDNSKTYTALGDRKVLGSQSPDYSIGFNNDFTFKGFDLNVFLFARVGQMFVSNYANKFEPNAIENGANVDYWTPENPTNDYPRPNANISRAALPFATTLGYKDGSYLKIRNITLGYTMPQSLSSKIHVSSIRLYVSAKNYFTFSKVEDYDPEGSGSFDRPLSKLILGGINIEL